MPSLLLLKRPHDEIEKLANHMGVTYTQKLIDDIADAVQLDKLKEGKMQTNLHSQQLADLNVYRKGICSSDIFKLKACSYNILKTAK